MTDIREPMKIGLNALWLVALTFGALLSGCVPVHVAGYEPLGAGERANLGCLMGIDNLLRTDLQAGVVRMTWADLDYKHEIVLNSRIVIPPDVTVRLLSREFIAESPDWDMPKVLTVQSINGRESMNTLQGASGDAGIFDFWFSERPGVTGLPQANTFVLKSPLLAINDKAYKPPDVMFRSTSKWGVALCVQ